MHPEELDELAAKTRAELRRHNHHLSVCTASACLAAGAEALYQALDTAVKAQGRESTCALRCVGCQGLCAAAPLVALSAADPLDGEPLARYSKLSPAQAPALVAQLGEAPEAGTLREHLLPSDLPFFARQRRLVLENAGRIDPEQIESAIAAGAYRALFDALTSMTPADVIVQVTRSGLRGRGGAGYATGLKWTTVAKADAPRKYVICNADEGDPGAYMDRKIMESDPHRVLEGMAIAGYAVGASTGYIYIRNAYSLAIKRLRDAIRFAKKLGVLGQQIGETTFSFDVELRLGAGAFVCGEESALIAAIEGRRGVPSPRPPYPAAQGLYGAPTLINNVETLANIPPIIREGGDAFASLGLPGCTGTKVFALSGDILNSGLVEVPMGTTLRELIFDIGGGIPGGQGFKAVQMGGPSGGCIAADGLDIPIAYESLARAGTFMGSGGMIVFDEHNSMVDVARYFMEFCRTESCGKCVPCRAGTAQMHDLLVKIAAGQAGQADLALLERLCDLVKHTSLCGLGQSAPNPLLSTLRSFRGEYLALLAES
jgi:bidirectional [NiFe] hydrogenase diaphorase subunit